MARPDGEDRSAAPRADPGAAPLVEFRNVTKRFGAWVAIEDFSLVIHEGEFFALLGPSGCGKTTLLRMLAGFEVPSEGQILLAGEDVARIPPYRRPVNMMFQSYALFPHMTVAQNIAFGLKQDRMPRGRIERRVKEMLALVQLGEFAGRKPDRLSGGQRQRVALARCLAKRPKLLLLDEPLAALDRKLREQTQFELVDIQEKLGVTFIIVTHDQEEAMTVSGRMAVMERGRLAQVGAPAEIYENPASRYVADFIGDVNLIEGRVARTEAGLVHVDDNEIGVPIRMNESAGAKPGRTVWVALRPEKLRIAQSPPAHTKANCAVGTVLDIAYFGDLSMYHVKLDNGRLLKVSRTNRTRLVERPITWNDRVHLSWESDAGVVLTQ